MRIVDLLESFILIALLTILFYLSRPVETPKNLLLPPGSIDSIISQLQAQGFAVGGLDAWLLRYLGAPQSGWIYLGKTRMERLDFLRHLGSAQSRFEKITLIPGETTVIFLDQLAKTLDLNATKLDQAYRELSPYPEAGILADSYNVPLRYDERQVINYLVNLSEKRYRRLAEEGGIEYDPKSWKEILTIASIIQKEAANRQEMPLVASVIYNRLRKKMRLQMDGTLNYGRYSHVRVTPQRIRDDNSSYNTYKRKGLPDAPVANVSIPAIEAALHPAKTPYLYFFRNDRGTHNFFENYKEHLKEVQKKRREIKERGNEEKR